MQTDICMYGLVAPSTISFWGRRRYDSKFRETRLPTAVGYMYRIDKVLIFNRSIDVSGRCMHSCCSWKKGQTRDGRSMEVSFQICESEIFLKYEDRILHVKINRNCGMQFFIGRFLFREIWIWMWSWRASRTDTTVVFHLEFYYRARIIIIHLFPQYSTSNRRNK